MKKRFKCQNYCRFMVLVVVILSIIMCGYITQVHAKQLDDNPGIDTCMKKISSYGVDLSISSSGKASIYGSVKAKSGNTYVKVTLQQLSGRTWSKVKTWEDSSSGTAASVVESYTVSKGTYRLAVYVKADTESKTIYSDKQTY